MASGPTVNGSFCLFPNNNFNYILYIAPSLARLQDPCRRSGGKSVKTGDSDGYKETRHSRGAAHMNSQWLWQEESVQFPEVISQVSCLP